MINFSPVLSKVDPRSSWIGYLIGAGTVLSFGIALLDPSASRELSLLERVLFWSVTVAVALILLEGVQMLFGRTPWASRLTAFAQVLIAGAIGAFLFSAFSVVVLDRLLALPGSDTYQDELSVMGILEELGYSAGGIILFWSLLNAPRLLMIAYQQEDMETPQHGMAALESNNVVQNSTVGFETEDQALLEFIRRLPHRYRSDVIAMTAELHYLRVYTRHGEALILMSFGRAVEALKAVPGMTIHRSHWVSIRHVTGLETQGDRVLCRLDNGSKFPVSRSNRTRLRKALEHRDRQYAVAITDEIVRQARS